MTEVTINQAAGNGAESAEAPIVEGVSNKTAAAVLENLKAAPGATATELAFALGMGRSTVTKALTALEKAGLTVRTAGGRDGKVRRPDIWACTPTTNDDKEDSGEAAEAATADAASATDVPAAATSHEPAHDGDEDTDEWPFDEPLESEPLWPRPLPVRLGKGQLRQLVSDVLLNAPEEEYTPHQIGKTLSRSSGAVANALERLVADQMAVRTSDKPRRYKADPGLVRELQADAE